jgi:hypothetical protein
MATTGSLYNHTLERFFEGLNLAGDTYKVVLLNGATFSGVHTTAAQVIATGAEVYNASYGWAQGGIALAGVTADVHDTDGVKFDASDVSQAVTGTIGPFDGFIINNTTDDKVLAFFELDTALTVTAGNNLGITWPANGIITVTVSTGT